MDQESIKNYEMRFDSSSMLKICYKDDEFHIASISGHSSIQSEAQLEKAFDDMVDTTIDRLIILQKARKEFKKMSNEHRLNRSGTEKRLVG